MFTLEEWIQENFIIKINKRRGERTVNCIYVKGYIEISSAISVTNKNIWIKIQAWENLYRFPRWQENYKKMIKYPHRSDS